MKTSSQVPQEEEIILHSKIANETQLNIQRANIPSSRLKQQFRLLLLLFLPAVFCLLLILTPSLHTFVPLAIRGLLVESLQLVVLNSLAWLCLLSALRDSTANIGQSSAEKSENGQSELLEQKKRRLAQTFEASLGIFLKLCALAWVVLRCHAVGFDFALAFVGTLITYLFFLTFFAIFLPRSWH